MSDTMLDRALGHPESRARLAQAMGTLPKGYRAARAAVRDWQAQKSAPAGTQYKIEYDAGNRPVVVVEQDILAGVPKEKQISTVKERLRRQFPQGIQVGKNQILVDGQSRREMTFSRYSQWLRKNHPEVFADKLRAVNQADEILLASRDYVNEGLKHPRHDHMQDFARGTVQIQAGDNAYTANVIVGMRENGNMILYDIIDLNPTEITKKEPNTAITANPSPGADRSTVFASNTSIAGLPQDGNISGQTVTKPTYAPGLVRNPFASEVDVGTADAIDRIAKKAGITVEIADDVPAAGEYRDGVIRIRANAENPVRQVFVHELTHHLEQSDGYQALVDFYRANTEKSGVRLTDLVRAKQAQYAGQGIRLTADDAQREIIAEFCDTMLFTDERSIMRLAQENRSLTQKIRDWLHGMAVRLRGTREEKFVLQAETLYRRALDSADGQRQATGRTQYKIETLPDGKQYVKADRPVIQGDDPRQWSRQAEQFINETIRGGADITVYTPDGFAVQITDRSAYKLTDTHVQRIQKIGRDQLPAESLGAKMRAAGHIDELVETARWKNWQADKNGSHANDIGEQGFDYFTTYFEDENGDYYRVIFSAGVNAGAGQYINDDTDTAYSIGDMQKRNRSANNGSSASPAGSGALTARTVSDTSIPPSGQNGNPGGQNISGESTQHKVDGSDYYDLLRRAGYTTQADALQRAAAHLPADVDRSALYSAPKKPPAF